MTPIACEAKLTSNGTIDTGLAASRHRQGFILPSALLIVAAYAAIQYWWLPPDGFLTGDQGAKYLGARAVLQHGPLHPWIEGPGLEFDAGHQWQEPFLIHNGDHIVGLFPWLLSILTAPFLWLFGLRGLYVVPALSAAATFVAASRIGRALGQSREGAWSGWCALLATPMLVYGAELWEHAPSVAMSTWATALLMPGSDRNPSPFRHAAAGVSLAAAAALRAEVLLMIPALTIAWIAAGPSGRSYRTRVRELVPFAAGAAVGGAVVLLGNKAVYGTFVPYQVSSNLAIGLPYVGVRIDTIWTLILPTWHRKLFVLGLAMLGLGFAASSLHVRRRAAHVAIGLLLFVSIAIPLGHTHVQHRPWLSTFGAQNIAQTWPFIYVLAYAGVVPFGSKRERFLLHAMALFLFLVFVTMPHTGGAQWSPRFFLAATPLGAIIAVQLLERARAAGRQFSAVVILGVTALVTSVAVQVYGLTYLATFKSINASITRATASRALPGELIVSDLYWFPEVTATLYPTHRLLFAPSAVAVGEIAERALSTGTTHFWVAASTPLTRYVPPETFSAGGQTAHLVEAHDLKASSLILYEYSSARR